MTEFHFDNDYRNLEQVRSFIPDFLARFAELDPQMSFAYNRDFRCHMGLTGDEDTAIFLCQALKRLDEITEQVAQALARGYVEINEVNEPMKCCSVIAYGFNSDGTGWQQFADCRLVHGITGRAVLPKRARTKGYNLWTGHVLAKLAN